MMPKIDVYVNNVLDIDLSNRVAQMLEHEQDQFDLKALHRKMEERRYKRKEAYELHVQGFNYVEIAKRLGIEYPAAARSRVHAYAKHHGLPVLPAVLGGDHLLHPEYRYARREYAWHLRTVCHESFRQIGARLGVSITQGHSAFCRHGRSLRLSYADIDQIIKTTGPRRVKAAK